MSEEHYLPVFQNEALCRHYNSEWWFPEYDGTENDREARKIEQIAKSVCLECPAYYECDQYALKYSGLDGIWAAKNKRERHKQQRRLGILTQRWLDTWPLMLYNRPIEELED